MAAEPEPEVSSSRLNSPATGGGTTPSGVATTFMLLPFAKSVYCPPGTDAIRPFPLKLSPHDRVRPMDELDGEQNTLCGFRRCFSIPILIGCASILSQYETSIAGEFVSNL